MLQYSNLRGVTLRLNFRLKGYVLCQLTSIGPLDGGMAIQYSTTMPLKVFIQKDFVANYIQLKLNFILENPKNRFLSHLFGTLGVMYAFHL